MGSVDFLTRNSKKINHGSLLISPTLTFQNYTKDRTVVFVEIVVFP